MANTFCRLDVHVVFCTKSRRPWLAPDIESRVWEYLGGIAVGNHMHPHNIGEVDDHVHVAVGLPPTLSVSSAVKLLKGSSSKWIHDTFPSMRGL